MRSSAEPRAYRPHLATVVRAGVADVEGGTTVGQLVDVQFWMLGRDVEHPAGNLLRRLGFTRQPAPGGAGPSRYQRDDDAVRVVFWPCGVFFGMPDRGRLLVRGLEPALVTGSPADMFDPLEVFAWHDCGSPCPPAALRPVVEWFAEYEAAVERTAGVDHRRPRPGRRPALAPSRPCSLERAWRELAASWSMG